jgi:hypothetical protein
MKIIRVVKIPAHTYLENDNRLKAWEVVYKLKGNKHHRMQVFAYDQLGAYTRAVEVGRRLKQT